jgi:ankyrin repeat protein
MAARYGEPSLVRQLLGAGLDPEQRDVDGRTPLHLTAESPHGNIAAARLLLAAGADVNACDAADLSPLVYAVSHDHVELARDLIAHGADVNVWSGEIEVAVHRHSDPSAPPGPRTPAAKALWRCNPILLNEAIIRHHSELARDMILADAAVNATDNEGRTPLDHARRHELDDVAALLESRGGRLAQGG